MSFITMRQQEFGREPKRGLGGEYQTHVHPIQHLGQFHYWLLPFYSLHMYKYMTVSSRTQLSDRAHPHPLIFRNLHFINLGQVGDATFSPKPQTIIYF